MRVTALFVAFAITAGCASSETIEDDYVPPDGATDTGGATVDAPGTDTGTPASDTSVSDTGTASTDSTTVDDTGGGTMDSEFPDFGGGGDTGFMFPEGGAGTCAVDTDCTSPFNCCEMTKMRCGFKFGPSCMTF